MSGFKFLKNKVVPGSSLIPEGKSKYNMGKWAAAVCTILNCIILWVSKILDPVVCKIFGSYFHYLFIA